MNEASGFSGVFKGEFERGGDFYINGNRQRILIFWNILFSVYVSAPFAFSVKTPLNPEAPFIYPFPFPFLFFFSKTEALNKH
ncbi:hypothetical protein BpHYR1_008787 [Brachionus plicatilis]|uniref:Uncharacterized protein n=1 Tax=Brachionus plicatilis TaxID=10195 RepID=A0A3M7SC38_BRAPC|nr:hypothetical protein BpHYR1_008787 [Brachionus plicatilis]